MWRWLGAQALRRLIVRVAVGGDARVLPACLPALLPVLLPAVVVWLVA